MAHIAVEAESLRAESNWGLTLQAETVADEITRSAKSLRVDLTENARKFQEHMTESLQAVRLVPFTVNHAVVTIIWMLSIQDDCFG